MPIADVTVIIPAYNRARYVGAAIESALAQEPSPRQIVVVDDGSKDGTAEVAKRSIAASGGRVEVIEQPNAGPSAARNRGLEVARGEYLAFLDADDLWLPGKLAVQLAMLERDPQALGAVCRQFQFRDTLDDLGRPQPQNQVDDPSFEHLFLTMCIQASATLMRRGPIADLRFEDADRPTEDAMFFVQVCRRGRWRLCEEQFSAYRIHGVQVTADPWHGVKHVEARVRWLQRHQHEPDIGPERATRLADTLWSRLISNLEKQYYLRNFAHLDAIRQHVRAERPDLMAKSFLNTRKLYPRWVYRVPDLLRPPHL